MTDVSLYEAPRTLKGHGRPNVFLEGGVGQKYKDLDSGLEYVCTGERGFIKVDGDDQSEMYNWELVESGGSTGSGRFDINATPNDGSTCTLDKTFDEIKSAYDSGMVVSVIFDDFILSLSSIDDNRAIFNGIMDTGSNVMISKIYVSRTAGATYSAHTINY